jgi:6-phosphogluconolactonase
VPARPLLLVIGTYTAEGGEGIYACDFNAETGALSAPRREAAAVQPSYLAVHPSRKFLYAVNELSAPDGAGGGSVSAFALSAATGRLAPINSRPSSGGAPCHVSCHPGGKWVATANFASGTVVVFPAGSDGALGEASCVIRHPALTEPDGVTRSPHAHALVFDAGGRWAFASDLGIDRLIIYRFDEASGTLHLHDPSGLQARRGAGPRSLSFHPDGRRACMVNELDSTLTLLDLDPTRGSIGVVDGKSTLPDGWTGANASADVHVHPTGRFVYCSNRGHDSIAAFAIHGSELHAIGHRPTGGKWPRSFCVDPEGRWLLVANQHTHDVACFRIDPSTGALEPTGPLVKVPAPTCLVLVPRVG